ncbi:MAG TPA: hypothetical protein VLA88_03910 [Candidatus Saccharimonadales bacterium]|nr:hypothetical protein [Candidatus Saccharimonadales bacterium]
MLRSAPPDIDMHALEKVGEAHGRFAELLEDLLGPNDGLQREFEAELPVSSGELLELATALGLDDLLLHPGDLIGTCEYHQPWDWNAISDEEDTTGIGKLSLRFANSFLIPRQPTSVSILAHTRREHRHAPPRRMMGLSAYYVKGMTDAQQVIGLYSPSCGSMEAYRLTYWSYKDELVYKESISRPSDFAQTNTFVSEIRPILRPHLLHDEPNR